MNCMDVLDPNYCVTESPESIADQNKAEDQKTEQKSIQESGHYYWCPAFGHVPNCQYLSYGFQDPNYWPSTMANPYPMPYDNKTGEKSDQKVNATPNPRIKTVTNGMEIERLYSCRLCDQLNDTKDVSLLRKHIDQHLGKVRPFVCRVCDKPFKFRSNCRNHIIAHSVVRKNYRRVSAPSSPTQS